MTLFPLLVLHIWRIAVCKDSYVVYARGLDRVGKREWFAESMRINATLHHFAISGNVLCASWRHFGPSNIGCRWHNLQLIIFFGFVTFICIFPSVGNYFSLISKWKCIALSSASLPKGRSRGLREELSGAWNSFGHKKVKRCFSRRASLLSPFWKTN